MAPQRCARLKHLLHGHGVPAFSLGELKRGLMKNNKLKTVCSDIYFLYMSVTWKCTVKIHKHISWHNSYVYLAFRLDDWDS